MRIKRFTDPSSGFFVFCRAVAMMTAGASGWCVFGVFAGTGIYEWRTGRPAGEMGALAYAAGGTLFGAVIGLICDASLCAISVRE